MSLPCRIDSPNGLKDAETDLQRYWKVKAQVKAEMKNVSLGSTLTSTSAYLARRSSIECGNREEWQATALAIV